MSAREPEEQPGAPATEGSEPERETAVEAARAATSGLVRKVLIGTLIGALVFAGLSLYADVASLREKPQNRRKEARSSKASASFTSLKSYQRAKTRAFSRLSGGQPCSPFAAADTGTIRPSASDQSIRPDKMSRSVSLLELAKENSS